MLDGLSVLLTDDAAGGGGVARAVLVDHGEGGDLLEQAIACADLILGGRHAVARREVAVRVKAQAVGKAEVGGAVRCFGNVLQHLAVRLGGGLVDGRSVPRQREDGGDGLRVRVRLFLAPALAFGEELIVCHQVFIADGVACAVGGSDDKRVARLQRDAEILQRNIFRRRHDGPTAHSHKLITDRVFGHRGLLRVQRGGRGSRRAGGQAAVGKPVCRRTVKHRLRGLRCGVRRSLFLELRHVVAADHFRLGSRAVLLVDGEQLRQVFGGGVRAVEVVDGDARLHRELRRGQTVLGELCPAAAAAAAAAAARVTGTEVVGLHAVHDRGARPDVRDVAAGGVALVQGLLVAEVEEASLKLVAGEEVFGKVRVDVDLQPLVPACAVERQTFGHADAAAEVDIFQIHALIERAFGQDRDVAVGEGNGGQTAAVRERVLAKLLERGGQGDVHQRVAVAERAVADAFDLADRQLRELHAVAERERLDGRDILSRQRFQ